MQVAHHPTVFESTVSVLYYNANIISKVNILKGQESDTKTMYPTLLPAIWILTSMLI